MRTQVLCWWTAVVLLAGALGVAPAIAAECPAPGGDPISRTTTTTGDFVLVGGGYGHGVGMSQYGARGAATLGCTAPQILAAYYPGATVAASVDPALEDLRVSLFPAGPTGTLPATVDVVAVSDSVGWTLGGVVRRQPAGRTWRASVGTAGRYTVTDAGKTVFAAAAGPLRVTLNGKVVRLPAKAHRYSRGALELAWSGSGRQTMVTAVIPSLDAYLYGLGEMPASWPSEALRAQAIAGRSYALVARERRSPSSSRWATCRCDVYDSVADQVYGAYDQEAAGPRWVQAVDDTSGQTLRSAGTTATAFYNSSSGGYVESSQFVFGGALGYSAAFSDSRWERASANPYTTWAVSLSAAKVGAAFGVGTALAVRTPAPLGQSGRVGDPAHGAGGVVIRGTTGTVTVSGPVFRSRLALRSALFAVKTAIDQRYEAIGGATSRVGAPTGPEADVTGGRVRVFQAGRIYWGPSTGAMIVRGALLDKYLDYGGPDSRLRLPTTDGRSVTGGTAIFFQGGRIYASAAHGAHVLFGAILTRFRAVGGPGSQLGMPVSDVYETATGRRADFQGGRILWYRESGATRVIYT